MDIIQLLGSTLGFSMLAGINLYATILTVGLGIRFNFIQIPTHLESLSILTHEYILISAGIAYILEFFADKIPWVDSLWDAIHTFIRPFGAALIAFQAFGNVDIAIKISIIILCGGVALSSHTSKSSIRLVANHSPEPFTNIFLSLLEDFLVFFGTLITIKYPIIIFALTIIFLTCFAYVAPKIFRLIRLEYHAVLALFKLLLIFLTKQTSKSIKSDTIPQKYYKHFSKDYLDQANNYFVRCFSGTGINIGKNYLGYLCITENQLFFLVKKSLNYHKIDFNISKIKQVDIQKKLLFDSFLITNEDDTKVSFIFTKNKKYQFEKLIDRIK